MKLKTTGHKWQAVCIAAILMLMEEKFNNIFFVFKGAGCEVNLLQSVTKPPFPDFCGLIEFYNGNFYIVVHFSLDLIYLTRSTVVILQVHVPVVDQDLQKRMAGGGLCSSRPWDKGGRGGGGVVSKIFFRLFGPQFGLRIRGGGGRPLPRIRHCVHCMCIIVMVNLQISSLPTVYLLDHQICLLFQEIHQPHCALLIGWELHCEHKSTKKWVNKRQ